MLTDDPVIRLVNGFNKYSGRVEVYYNGTWGTVCDDRWDIREAKVVCRMLGFTDAMSALHYAFFGWGAGRIWLDEIRCTGTETSILHCSKSQWGQHNCGHHEDASVVCKPIVRLVDGTNSFSGRVEVFYEGEWGRVCDENWEFHDANVVCRMLGFPNATSLPRSFPVKQGSGKVWMDNVKCTGKETSILDCSKQNGGVRNSGNCKDASVACRPLPLRLVDGINSHSGTVEILYYGLWGAVSLCGKKWDIKDSMVICRMLGFPGAMYAPSIAAFYGRVAQVWLDNARCNGAETSLFSCSEDTWAVHECSNIYGISVFCMPPSVRLVNGTNSYSGRVEVKHDGTWGTVCDSYWDIDDASVICRMFGFVNAESASHGASFGPGTGKILLNNVSCTGNEASIWDCTKNLSMEKECGHGKDASVVCQPNAVRLVNGENSHSGLVEIHYIGEWGTVCDEDWDIDDANVVCRMLGFANATSASGGAKFGKGPGRIWLDAVKCTGVEKSIWDCTKTIYTDRICHHSAHASVICTP